MAARGLVAARVQCLALLVGLLTNGWAITRCYVTYPVSQLLYSAESKSCDEITDPRAASCLDVDPTTGRSRPEGSGQGGVVGLRTIAISILGMSVLTGCASHRAWFIHRDTKEVAVCASSGGMGGHVDGRRNLRDVQDSHGASRVSARA